MAVEVEGPDGKVHAFPDGTPSDEIHQKMTGIYGNPKSGLPAAGTPTPTAGAVMPGSQTVPGYMTSEDMENVMRAKLLGGPRAAATALEQAPGLVYQREYGKKVAGNQAALEDRQRAGFDILPGIDQLRRMVREANDVDWKNAAGPYNAQKQPASNEVWLSPSAWRAPEMTPTQARASYGWSAGDKQNQDAWRLQNEMEHLIGAVTDQYVAAVGKGVAGSDARMELFKDLMRRMMTAPTRAEAEKILDTAEASARNTFHLPTNPEGHKATQVPPGAARENPLAVKTPADARRYPSGTWIRMPDGGIGRVP